MIARWDPVHKGETVRSELAALASTCMQSGVKSISYHVTPPFCSQVSKKSAIFHFGYPKNVIKTYLDPSICEKDPIPDYVMYSGHVMSWRQAIATQNLSEAHRNFIRQARGMGFVDGVAVPLFGPLGRNSFFSLNFDREVTLDDETVVRPLVGVAQSCHRRICAIVRKEETPPCLSERESQVIYWVSRGKTNAEISIIMGLSCSTIDTYVKRIFAKLEVHDRLSAVLRGLEYSLIRIA